MSRDPFWPHVSNRVWLVRVSTCELVRVIRSMPATGTCTVLPERAEGLPITALVEDLHADQDTALQQLEDRSVEIEAYVKRERRRMHEAEREADSQYQRVTRFRLEALDRSDGIQAD